MREQTKIEQEVREIRSVPDYDGSGMNDMVDEFRDGRDVDELIGLLDSDDAELVAVGTWVFSELPFELYDTARYLSRLFALTEHPSPPVRFEALGAVYPALDADDPITRILIKRLLNDPNEGVRGITEITAQRLGLESLIE